MSNKKGGVAIEEVPGLLLFIFALIVIMVFFYGCSVFSAKNTYEQFKFSKDEIKSIEALNFFLRIPIDNEEDLELFFDDPESKDKKILDAAVEIHLNLRQEHMDRLTNIAQEYFSKTYNQNWRLAIFSEIGGRGSQDYQSKSFPGVDVAEASVVVPVGEYPEEFESIEVVLQVW